MSRVSGSITRTAVILIALLIILVPESAYNVALYGTNSGFDPTLHLNPVLVVQSVPGSAGTILDSSVDQFIQPSVDVIVLGGEDTFTPSTAAKIETAVAEGKILVVTYPCNHLFNASLPASNGGSAPGGQFVVVADPASAASKEIFAGLPNQFSLQGAIPDKEQVIARNGSIAVLNYDTGLPALLYGKYGKGYVIEWTTPPVPSYMNGITADTILDLLITRLLPPPVTTPTTLVTQTVPTTTILTTRPETIMATPSPVPSGTPLSTTGNVSVHSSPSGASILIDGIYRGTTPANLAGIPQGNHIIRLTQSGFYDYEGSIYIIPGDTANAFETLPPLSQAQVTAMPVPVIVPVVMAEPTPAKGLLENTSVIVGIIGVFTATIAAAVAIFPYIMKMKKD